MPRTGSPCRSSIHLRCLAILVSCLGLYGLVSLIAIQRTKEISIRKVLGATLQQLLSLMTKDFIKLLIWSLIIALPVAAIAMNKWLSSYAYHVSLSWWMFLMPVVAILVADIAGDQQGDHKNSVDKSCKEFEI